MRREHELDRQRKQGAQSVRDLFAAHGFSQPLVHVKPVAEVDERISGDDSTALLDPQHEVVVLPPRKRLDSAWEPIARRVQVCLAAVPRQQPRDVRAACQYHSPFSSSRMGSNPTVLHRGRRARIVGLMATSITRQQALAWRMRRQLLDPPGRLPVGRVVGRLCGVQAQVASSAELAVRVRRETSRAGEVGRALDEGRLVKTWAMRGALHLLSPENGATFLSIMAADRLWESWRRYFATTSERMDVLWRTIRDVLDGEPLTRVELADAVTARRGLAYAEAALRSSYGEVLKPLAWKGEVCFGPSR